MTNLEERYGEITEWVFICGGLVEPADIFGFIISKYKCSIHTAKNYIIALEAMEIIKIVTKDGKEYWKLIIDFQKQIGE